MRDNPLPPLGEALRIRRKARRLTQPMLAARVGRSSPRISELERDLLNGRAGKDRLGLLVQVCDALDLVPMLVPREQAQTVRRLIGSAPPPAGTQPAGRPFDELFVDLSEDEHEEDR